MTDREEHIGVPHKFVGYFAGDIGVPTFVLPVFKNLDNDMHYIQVCSQENKIQDFVKAPSKWIALAYPKTIIKRIQNDVLFGIVVNGSEVFFAEEASFSDYISVLLRKGTVSQYPGFALNLAKFVNDVAQISKCRKLVLDATPPSSPKSRKHFLENNIVREILVSKATPESIYAINHMKIDIGDDGVMLKMPADTSEEVKAVIGREIPDIIKNFTNTKEIKITFLDKENDFESIALAVKNIKRGFIAYSNLIFDTDFCLSKFGIREACILIPEAAVSYFHSPMNKTDTVRSIISKEAMLRPLSESTGRKIVELHPVSFVSAMLFRLWIFFNVKDANFSRNFALHVCAYKIKPACLEEFTLRLKAKAIIGANSHLRTALFPVSMILAFVNMDIVDLNQAVNFFEFSTTGSFNHYALSWDYRKRWSMYCMTDFLSVERSTINNICQAMGHPSDGRSFT